MKIRQGFVSNSSSSSYVVVLGRAQYDEILRDMTGFERHVISSLEPVPQTFLEQEVVVISWMSGNCDSFEYVDCSDFAKYLDKEEEEDVEVVREKMYDTRSKFNQLAKKAGAITHRTDDS